MSPPTLSDVEAAARRLAGRIERTPFVSLPDAPGGRDIRLKLENHQITRSFKPRGALNCAFKAADERSLTGLITYSSGNHGQATALAAQRLGISCTVVSPEDVRLRKRMAMEERGARVVLAGLTSAERMARALEIAEQEGLLVIPPYDHPDVIAGQGTAGLELDEQAEELGLLVSPIGGGGLISGLSIALGGRRPDLPIWGVEPADADDARRSLASGELLSNEEPSTSACDGLRNTCMGDLNWRIVQERVAGIVAVPDDEVQDAVARIDAAGFGPVEPSGAAALAAVLNGRIPLPDAPIACIVSGGNASSQA